MLTQNAETAVLGSMLIDERCVPAVMQQLREEDFPTAELRHVFAAIRGIFLERGPVDAVTVLDRLGKKSYEPTLRELMQITPTAANVMEYARILREQRQLREIQNACMQICEVGTDLAAARRLLSQAAALLVDKQTERDRSLTELIIDMLDRQNDKTPPDYLDFGIPALNELVRLGRGKFAILGADSSVGKTALALQFALSFARTGKRVGFFSYETTLPDAADRIVANDADVSLTRIKGKRLGVEEIEQIVAAGTRSNDLSLRVLETARYTVSDIRARTIARGFDVILIDYVQLIPTRRTERYDAVTEISIGLHALAQELGVTVIGLSQVTVPETDKKGNRRFISKDDLRESRQLKQDADVIMLLDLLDPKDRYSKRSLQVAKNRDGPLGYVVLEFHPSRMRFDYVPPFEDPEVEKSRERNDKMDANREASRKKEREKARGGAIEGQGSVFTDLADGEGGDLPF